jgi:UDP-N-acetylglucosamine diphosphorylase / glucose-1-phosphate thymidylyltransferase / UDP-N-acetylgalactosamine diphosphorylase / glucosamine-1-phosphate N-acetyltransferase / galactosamine-1-phosphate N-acetyltransferase
MQDSLISMTTYLSEWCLSPFARSVAAPWHITADIEALVSNALAGLSGEYDIHNNVAVHESAAIEAGAVLKGPLLIGPRCFVASTAYLRGGAYLASDCIVGPGSELKSSFMFSGSKLAHFNFVGNSILGSHVNVEAGAVIANYRNELSDKQLRIHSDTGIIETGVEKFGALVGDNSCIGANAVVAPGALLKRWSQVGRLELVDQRPA